MPTNLPERSKAIWARAIAEKNPERKLELLREFYSSFPKHKSTERLEVSIKKQISILEEKIERARRKKVSSYQPWSVKKEEFLLAVVGNFDEVQEFCKDYGIRQYSFFELLDRPCLSAMSSNGVTIQLVLILFSKEVSEQKQRYFISIIRNADAVLLLGDESQVNEQINWLEDNNIHPCSKESGVSIKLLGSGGLRLFSRHDIEKQAREMLKSYGIKNGTVIIGSNSSLDDLEAAIFEKSFKVCLTRRKTSLGKFEFVEESGIDNTVLKILKAAGLMRIFTKEPSSEIAERPVLMREGSTVIEVAEKIHKDLAKGFLYARIWRDKKYNGEKVGKDFVLLDGDIIELHAH